MKRLFILMLFFSFVIHVVIIYFVPSFAFFNQKEDKQPEYMKIQLIEIPKKKPIPPDNAITKEPVVKTAGSSAQQAKSKMKINQPVYEPKSIDIASLPMPDLDLNIPVISESEKILLPSIPDGMKQSAPASPKSVDISKEIASLGQMRNTANKSSSDNLKNDAETSPETKKKSSKGQIYTLDNISNNRKIVFVPPNPDFSLSNDTKVKMKFEIDKNGNTINIQCLTPTVDSIERISREYIRQMRFSAVLYDNKDIAEITLTFNVRK